MSMLSIAECDRCKKRTDTPWSALNGSLPDGWVSITFYDNIFKNALLLNRTASSTVSQVTQRREQEGKFSNLCPNCWNMAAQALVEKGKSCLAPTFPDNLPEEIEINGAIFRSAVRHKYEIMATDEKLDTHAHLPFLKEHAKGNVLEIGVHCGISTTALLAGLEENGGHLWSVDVHPSCRYVHYGHPQWTFICPWSGDKRPEEYFDLAFVDGDHSYEGVLADLIFCGNRVNKGGLIFCHDADTASFPGVREAIEVFCDSTGRRHELRPGSHGLEVIYV